MNKHTITAENKDGSRFGYTKSGKFNPHVFFQSRPKAIKVCVEIYDDESGDFFSLHFLRDQFKFA